MQISVRGSDTQARGALHYDISYGDGTSSRELSPQFCSALPRSVQRTWSFSHRYADEGTYRIRVTVGAICSSGTATASVEVKVS